MWQSQEIAIPLKNPVRSLCWEGDHLVDWVAGGNRYYLDGRFEPRYVNYSYSFDAAVVSPSGQYAVIYTNFGTKGLVLHQGKILREINRSFYQAHVYEYPITLFQLPDGREVLAHCPEHYCQLEIEDVATGERLTKAENRKPMDFFFSRLAANGAGTFLLSAGWVWHPMDVVKVFDVNRALEDPAVLDKAEWSASGEEANACFLDNDLLAFAIVDEEYDDSDDDDDDNKVESPKAFSGQWGRLDLSLWGPIGGTPLRMPAGTLMGVGRDHCISFYEYPKLYDLTTGKVVSGWPHLQTGLRVSSILWGKKMPLLALDYPRRRFATATDKEINVVQLIEG